MYQIPKKIGLQDKHVFQKQVIYDKSHARVAAPAFSSMSLSSAVLCGAMFYY